jgi:hypothetical protein
MKSTFISIFIFLVILFSFDKIIGGILEFGFYKQLTGPNYQIIESITTNRADLVVLGNSRAQHHYNPKIFQQKTGLTFTNSGINGGYGIYLPAFQLEEMSNNYLPKAILIEIDPNALGYWKGNYDRLSVLMPFIDRYPKLSEYVGLRDNFLKLKLFSKSYKYNSLIYNELIYNLFSSKFNHVKSFIPNYKCMTKRDSIAGVNKIRNMSSPTMDINMELIFKKLINMAKSKNIKLIFVNSPIYNNTLNYNYSFAGKKAIQIMNDNNISFWDYSNDTSFFNKYYLFSDRLHLNNKGAELYSNIIADRLVAEGISIKK